MSDEPRNRMTLRLALSFSQSVSLGRRGHPALTLTSTTLRIRTRQEEGVVSVRPGVVSRAVSTTAS